jgi:hypothetical protein
MTNNLQRHVTSLPTSQALFDAGIRHSGEPLYWWRSGLDETYLTQHGAGIEDFFKLNGVTAVPAFLLSELLEVREAMNISMDWNAVTIEAVAALLLAGKK